MFRGLLIVVVTLVVLIATVVGVVGAGLHRIAAAQRDADANWHRPDASSLPIPATQAIQVAPPVDEVKDPPVRAFNSIDLSAKDASVHGEVKLVDPNSNRSSDDASRDEKARVKVQRRGSGRSAGAVYLTGFHLAADYAEWQVKVDRAGDYEIDLTYGCPQWQEGGRFSVKVRDSELSLITEGTRGATVFRVVPVGKLAFPAGTVTLTLRAEPTSMKSSCFMNLRGIELIPAPSATP